MTELDKAKKRLVLAAHDFWERAQDGDDLHWLFLNLVNHDEGGMEELLEKLGGTYGNYPDEPYEEFAKIEALYNPEGDE
jgi:hypothetical protein